MLSELRFALRSLQKSPGFSLVAILILALGIGANAGIFSFLNTILLRPLPYPESDRLLFIGEASRQVPNMSVAYPNFLDWRERQQHFTHLGIFRNQSFNLVGTQETERLTGGQISHDVLPALGVVPTLGRVFTAADDKPGAARTVLISDSLWMRMLGGSKEALGQTLTLSGEVYTIIGVLPAGFRFPSGTPDVWVPWGLFGDLNMNRGNHPGLYCVGRLKPGSTLESARADLMMIAQQLEKEYPTSNTGNSVSVQTLAERAMGQQRAAVWISFAAAVGVLLIACANVASLLLARAAARSKEFAVRTALGASRSQLVRIVLMESALLGLVGTAAGLLVGYGTMQGIKSLIPANSPIAQQTTMDLTVLLFTVLVGVGVTLLFGLVPALLSSRVNLNETLAAGGRSAGGHVSARWRSVLVVTEFAITLVLLFGSGLMLHTLRHLYAADLGFKTDRILTFGYAMPGKDWQDAARRRHLLDRALERLRAMPGVTQVGLTNPLPLSGGGNQTSYLIEGMEDPGPGKWFSTENNVASREYFEVVRIPLLRGQLFTGTEKPEEDRVCVIDQRFAESHFAGQDPIGRRVRFGGSAGTPSFATIIGVVGHVENYGLGQQTRVQLYSPYTQMTPPNVTFVLRTSLDPAALTSTLRAALRELEPTLPVFAVVTMDELFTTSVTNQRIMLTILAVFAGVALLLAAVGLYGVLTYIVSQRTREIGIRMALGATVQSVRQLMLGEGLRVALVGLGVGLVACLGLGRLMQSVLFGVSPFDPINLTVVAAVMIAIGLVASWVPAHRATQVDPVEALRNE
ncbi:MAG: ABC transporter permease [Opitutaceae bacterium]|nr:ABC transporter permease [Opitutaceae bacterium]